jgi:hypothetical protein
MLQYQCRVLLLAQPAAPFNLSEHTGVGLVEPSPNDQPVER